MQFPGTMQVSTINIASDQETCVLKHRINMYELEEMVKLKVYSMNVNESFVGDRKRNASMSVKLPGVLENQECLRLIKTWVLGCWIGGNMVCWYNV